MEKKQAPALPVELEAMNPSEYLDHEVEQFRQYLCDSGHLEDDPISDYWQSLYFAIKFFKERVKLDAKSPARVNRELLDAAKEAYTAMEVDFGDPDKIADDGSIAAGETMAITFKTMRRLSNAIASAEQLERSKP